MQKVCKLWLEGLGSSKEKKNKSKFFSFYDSPQRLTYFEPTVIVVFNFQAEIVSSRSRLRHVLQKLEIAEQEKRIRDKNRYKPLTFKLYQAFVAPRRPSPQAVLCTACFCSLLKVLLCSEKHYITDARTHRHPQLYKQIYPFFHLK